MRAFVIASSLVGTLATAGIASAEPCHAPTSTMTTYGSYNGYQGSTTYYAPAPAPVYAPAPVVYAPRPVYYPAPVVYAPRPVYYPAPVYRDPVYRQPTHTWRPVWHHGRRW